VSLALLDSGYSCPETGISYVSAWLGDKSLYLQVKPNLQQWITNFDCSNYVSPVTLDICEEDQTIDIEEIT
jgi:hypothetical protein